MATTIKPCASLPSCCDPFKPFRAFIVEGEEDNCPNYYKYLAVFDWDKCLLTCDNPIADSFSGGGISLTSPAWGDAVSVTTGPCCISGDPTANPPCGGAIKQNLVDGHEVFEDNGDGTATCIEATGNLSASIGQVSNTCDLYYYVTGYGGFSVDDEQYFWWYKDVRFGGGCTGDPPFDVIRGYLWND